MLPVSIQLIKVALTYRVLNILQKLTHRQKDQNSLSHVILYAKNLGIELSSFVIAIEIGFLKGERIWKMLGFISIPSHRVVFVAYGEAGRRQEALKVLIKAGTTVSENFS